MRAIIVRSVIGGKANIGSTFLACRRSHRSVCHFASSGSVCRRGHGWVGGSRYGIIVVIIVDNNDLLGDAIFVELGPIWFLAPTTRSWQRGRGLVGRHGRLRKGEFCSGRESKAGSGGRDGEVVVVLEVVGVETGGCHGGSGGRVRLVRRLVGLMVGVSVMLMVRRMSRRSGGGR